MARTKRSARKSTGGRAPRKKLAPDPENTDTNAPAESSVRYQPYTVTARKSIDGRIPSKKTEARDHEVTEIDDSDDPVESPVSPPASTSSTANLPSAPSGQTARKSTGGRAPRKRAPVRAPAPGQSSTPLLPSSDPQPKLTEPKAKGGSSPVTSP